MICQVLVRLTLGDDKMHNYEPCKNDPRLIEGCSW